MKFLFLLISLLCIPVVYSLQISEIMYDPDGKDSNREWIEIYANESDIDLAEVSLCGRFIHIRESNSDNSTILSNGSYALITNKNITIIQEEFNITIKFYVNNTYLCEKGLVNSRVMNLILEKENSSDNASYDPNINIQSGNSVSRKETDNGTIFLESVPTPGYANEFFDDKNEDENESAEIADPDSDECDWKTEIIVEKEIFEEDEKFTFKTKASKLTGGKANLTGEARLIDQKGNTIKKYNLFEDYEATYSKTVAISNSQVSGEMRIESELKTSCDDYDFDNNIETRYVYVKKNIDISTKERQERRTPLFEQGSRLEIDGDEEKAELFFYRGNISKYAVYITLESDGEKAKSTVHLKDKFSEYEMSLPFEKCSEKNKVIVEGLGLHEEKEFIKEDGCENKTSASSSLADHQIFADAKDDNNTSDQSRQANRIASKITGKAILDDKTADAAEFDGKRIALIILLALSVCLNALFIWHR